MAELHVYNSVSLDGSFTDGSGNMAWAHKNDPEWTAYVASNASGSARFVFGRKTYDQMASFWPTDIAQSMMPEVAKAMNATPKFVASRQMTRADWANTTVLQGDLVQAITALKQTEGPDLLIMGSGEIVAQLSQARLIDQYQIVLNAVALGSGRGLFAGLTTPLPLTLTDTRSFQNGNVVLTYRL